MNRFLLFSSVALLALPARADNVINDDLIISGSICSGVDCVNGESFAFDTFIIKENNLRILFRDTSTSAQFPTVDWRLALNDSNNGGLSYFAIENVDANVQPLSILSGAPHQALVVDAGGVGLGIDPQRALHVAATDTPTIRIEQTAELGWEPQVWDIGANESNLFFRDSTAGAIPLRVLPSPQDNTVVIAPEGRVGIGTEVPGGTLHVLSAASFPPGDTTGAQMTVENTLGDDANLLMLSNHGAVQVVYENTAIGSLWVQRLGLDPEDGTKRAWSIGEQGQADAMVVTHEGNVRIAGTLSSGSSRSIKRNIRPVEAESILHKLSGLRISRWQYKRDDATHVGPMAEDFHKAFGLGEDPEHIAASDLAGVAISSVQAVNDLVKAQRTEIRALKGQVDSLESRLRKLEALLTDR